MKVIIVDDEFSSLSHFLDKMIEAYSLDYHFFKDDAEEIVRYAKVNKVDGAFLDIYMPSINGLALAENLVKINPDIKIVFVTGGTFSMNDVKKNIANNVLGFIYKPIEQNVLSQYIYEMENKTSQLKVVTFGTFDCFINDNLVKFSSSKSKELFALLIAMNGKSLSMSQAITYIWPDKNIDQAKILYRDAVWRLRQTLKEINFNCVEFARALLTLDKRNIKCDYYDLLEDKSSNYNGQFLVSYDWSMEWQSMIDNKISSKK